MDGKAEGDYKIFIVKTCNSTFETCEWMSFSLAFDVGMHSFLRTLLFKRHNSALVCLSRSLTFSELKYYLFYIMITLLPYFSILVYVASFPSQCFSLLFVTCITQD